MEAPHPLKNDPETSNKGYSDLLLEGSAHLIHQQGLLSYLLLCFKHLLRCERYNTYQTLSLPLHKSNMATSHQQPQVAVSADTKPICNIVLCQQASPRPPIL